MGLCARDLNEIFDLETGQLRIFPRPRNEIGDAPSDIGFLDDSHQYLARQDCQYFSSGGQAPTPGSVSLPEGGIGTNYTRRVFQAPLFHTFYDCAYPNSVIHDESNQFHRLVKNKTFWFNSGCYMNRRSRARTGGSDPIYAI